MSKILIDKATVKLVLEALNATESDCGSHAWEREQEAITALREALATLAEQPAQQGVVAYGMWDTMLGKDNRMMMVRLDKGQDGCTVPLYTTPQAQPAPEIAIADAYRAGVDSGIAAEREACAKVCDSRGLKFFSESPFAVECHGLAAAIRARGNT